MFMNNVQTFDGKTDRVVPCTGRSERRGPRLIFGSPTYEDLDLCNALYTIDDDGVVPVNK